MQGWEDGKEDESSVQVQKKTLFENKKDLPFLTTKDPHFFEMIKNRFENKRSFCNFAALGRWSTAQWTPSVRCWPDLVSPRNRWYFLRTKCIYWEQSVFFLKTNFFSWQQSAFPREQSLFLRTNYFSWEQSAGARPMLDKDLFSRWSSAATSDAVGRTKWLLRTAGSGSSTQSKNCKAKLDRCAAFLAWHRFQTLFRFQTFSGSKLRIIAITYTRQPEPFSVHFKAKGKCIYTDK